MKRLLGVMVSALVLLGLALAQGAMVRVAHLSPDAPAVDILVNGQRAIQNLAVQGGHPLPAPARGQGAGPGGPRRADEPGGD